jgi:hypothetical protein
MLQKEFHLPIDQISTETAHYAIGFATISAENNVENAVSAGSGTLVTVGSVRGILTAAHVIAALPTTGEVGLVTQADHPHQFARQVIIMDHTEPIVWCGDNFGSLGPDLGFLRLPSESIGWISAKKSFCNLAKQRGDVLAKKHPARSHYHAVAGIVHDMTTDVPSELPHVRRIQFTEVFCGAHHLGWRYLNDYELYYFEPKDEPGFSVPKNFEGVSGGAVWRFYVVIKDNKPVVIDRRLLCVPFYQSPGPNGKLELTCHGPEGIYGSLIDKITERWPGEVAGGD